MRLINLDIVSAMANRVLRLRTNGFMEQSEQAERELRAALALFWIERGHHREAEHLTVREDCRK